jgi:hypothetical protein
MSGGGMAKPLVGEAITTIPHLPGASMLFYRAALPLSRRTLSYVARVIRRHRAAIGSSWRKLNPGQQALLVWRTCARARPTARWPPGSASAPPRPGATSPRPCGCSPPAPRTGPALRAARKAGHAFVIIDGTLIAIDRVTKDRPFYSGNHRRHGMNLQVISAPAGEILWVSGRLPAACTT